MCTFAYTAILPCHNSQQTLPQALKSLSQLDPPPERIVVVDDASTDETATLAAAQANVEVIHSDQNVGPSRARNLGAESARTPWLLFVDADVYVHRLGLPQAIESLISEPELAGVMGVFEPDAPRGPFAGRFKNFYRHHEIAGMPNPPHIFTSACFLIRRDAYLAVGGFDEAYGLTPCEDNEFYFRLVAAGHSLKYLTAFSFTHDKPLGLARLLREDAQRAEAIIRNLRGQLGTPRRGFDKHERTGAAARMAAGLGVVAGPLLVAVGYSLDEVAACWPFATLAGFCAWLLAAVGLAGFEASILRAAWRQHGWRFAWGTYWYRALEMLAAAAGIARAMLPLPTRGTDEHGGRSGHVAAT